MGLPKRRFHRIGKLSEAMIRSRSRDGKVFRKNIAYGGILFLFAAHAGKYGQRNFDLKGASKGYAEIEKLFMEAQKTLFHGGRVFGDSGRIGSAFSASDKKHRG